MSGFHAKIRVTLVTDSGERFYGPGVQDLLDGIRRTGRVKDACEEMGLSYSKGRRILKHAEAVLGYPLVKRQQGGRDGGSSALTPEAEAFMDRYAALSESTALHAGEKLSELF